MKKARQSKNQANEGIDFDAELDDIFRENDFSELFKEADAYVKQKIEERRKARYVTEEKMHEVITI